MRKKVERKIQICMHSDKKIDIADACAKKGIPNIKFVIWKMLKVWDMRRGERK